MLNLQYVNVALPLFNVVFFTIHMLKKSSQQWLLTAYSNQDILYCCINLLNKEIWFLVTIC